MDDVVFSEELVYYKRRSLKGNKLTGPDRIHGAFLHECSEIEFLCVLFFRNVWNQALFVLTGRSQM